MGMIATDGRLVSPGAYFHHSTPLERRPSNASAPSPKLSASVRSKESSVDFSRAEGVLKKKLIHVATISGGGETPVSRFDPEFKRRLSPRHFASERRSQPDISPNATLAPKNSAPLSGGGSSAHPRRHHPDIFVTCGTYDIPSLSGRRLSRGKAGAIPSLTFHHSTPHIPLSRTPSPSHSTHSMDAQPPSPSPFPFDLCPPSPAPPGLLPTPLLSQQHHKRQRSNSNSGSPNEKLL